MLEPVLGSLVREQVLLFIHVHGEGYAREISRYFEAPLDSVQKQLKRLESGSVLTCERKGRTLIYRFNKEYPFLTVLCRLLERVNYYYSLDIKDKITQKRYFKKNRKRRKGIRVIVREYGDR
ncbi:MAG: winged helix-turn-helix transcriptional regulator [Candidatus Aegiribacteria sp.]|nr:winged helix-turn-helix transcriptional regulator [Candidatus Aegiribacteria sp.]